MEEKSNTECAEMAQSSTAQELQNSTPAVPISFTLATKTDKRTLSTISDEEMKEQKVFISEINENSFNSSDDEFIIPLVEQKCNRISSKYAKVIRKSAKDFPIQDHEDHTAESNSLEQEAISEILSQAQEADTIEVHSDDDIPLLLKNRNPILDTIPDEEERFRKDVELRPGSSTPAQYQHIPVKSFAKAILKGMGWKEGAPIGSTNAKVVQVVELQPRIGRLGLGADPSVLPSSSMHLLSLQ